VSAEIVSQLALLTGVHVQRLLADTVTLPVPLAAGTDTAVRVNERPQSELGPVAEPPLPLPQPLTTNTPHVSHSSHLYPLRTLVTLSIPASAIAVLS